MIAISTTLSGLDHVPGIGEIRDDGIGVSLGDADVGRDIAQAYLRIAGDAEQDPPVGCEKAPVGHSDILPTIY